MQWECAPRLECGNPPDSIPRPHPPAPAVRESKVTIKIPRPLYRRIQTVVEESGFDSPTDFIVYVLRDLMGESPGQDASTRGSTPEPASDGPGADFTQEELDAVRRKLKNLGYL